MKAALGTLKMLSIHPRAGSGVRAQHQLGTPMLLCQGGGMERDKELLCASSPWPGKPGVPRPAQWDGTALPPSHGHPEVGETRKVTDMGRGSLHPQTVGTPSALGQCRHSPTWRSTWQSRTVHLAPLPQSPLALSISGCHRRSGQMPPSAPRVTAHLPPQLLPAVHLEMVCIALLRPLRSLLPAGIKGCRPAVETHCLLARSLAVPAPPTPPPRLPPRHPPAISQLEEGQPQQSHSRPGCCLDDSPAMPQVTPISSCPAASLHPASLRAGGDALHPQRQAAAPQGR